MSLLLRLADGEERELAADDWHRAATAVDRAACRSLDGPVLDLGCGPGRMVAALSAHGVPALGVDASPAAVVSARDRGAPALCRSVYDRLPGEGRWHGVLLYDGNIGIGGDPQKLLDRVAALLAPRGVAIVELDEPGRPTTSTIAQLVRGEERTVWFPWATVGADQIGAVARTTAMRVVGIEQHGRRWFASLRRRDR